LLLGLPTLRLRGDYFAIVTLGLGEITRIVLNNWDSLTNGPNGISGIGRPALGGYVFSTTLDYYYLILAIAVITIFAMHRLMASRVGRAWLAIREDETAAEAMGINTFRYKLLAFVLGSSWAGLTGVFFAAKMAFVSPESFTFFDSVLILCMVVLGGMGSIPGIILGAFLLITLPEVFRDFQDYRMLAFGAALVLMMVFKPQGLLGTVKANSK
jgi:branched-chain amino acid transport system permease protein